jgi:hypothetical protein
MAQTLLNKNLDWARAWRDRGPVAQRMYPALPSAALRSGDSAGSGGTTTSAGSGSGSGGTTTAPGGSGAQPRPTLAATIYPNLPSAGQPKERSHD